MEIVKRWALPAIQAVISIVLLFMVISSGLLPAKYLWIAIAALILLMAVTVLLARSRSGATRSLGSILAIFMSGMLVFSVVYVQHIMKTLDRIAGADTQIESMAVIVAKDNSAQSIEDTSGYKFGLYAGNGREMMSEMIEEVKRSNGDDSIDTKEYDTPLELAQGLLNGEVDAVICNKAYTELLSDAITDYTESTRVIFEKGFESKVEAGSAAAAEPESRNMTGHAYTVLISGIDVNGPISTTSRSDVNILMTVNPLTHKILLTTTPRDYYVYIPEISGDMRDKLTHAGIYGVKTSMRTLEELYGIKISDYVRINFDSLINLVDALGGVDVDSEYDFESYGFQFHKGINHLDGEQALAFSRERYAFSSGDNQRGQNQMLVLTAILDKLQSPALLKNPSGVLEVMGSSMQTSFTTDQITELISWQLDNGQGWEIERQAVTGTGDSQQTFSMKGTDLYVMWPDEEAVSEAAAKIAETMAN